MPDVVLRTAGTQSGTTPSNTTRSVAVDHDEDWRLKARIAAENPLTGAFQGNVEVVLEELDSSGAVTQTVVGTLSSVGKLNIRKVIHKSSATGLPGDAIKWQSTTKRAQALVRFSGANKNLTIRIRYRELVRGAHEPRHRQKNLGNFFPDDTVVVDPPDDPEPLPDDELPPGDDAGVDPPPEDPPPPEPIPGVSPALVVWPEPDRPTGVGVALEAKATMETALPTWNQVTTGATLTRVSGSVLTGTYSMRSYKATP